ncbi:cold-shock protein [Bacillus marinisedimentorum]|uniref:cold-shock protein n=1 Tax=Bacillus marinisedimentorum TaxID=1821260 RepID=UPI001B806F25|nr:cold-shock protein [Bacillus marinisedimentorum]
MAFNKRQEEEIKMEEVKIWECTSDDCNIWLRDNFKSEETPVCPVCNSKMESTIKELRVIHNSSSKW